MTQVVMRIKKEGYEKDFWYIFSMIAYLIESDTDVSIEIEEGVSHDFISVLSDVLEEHYCERHLRRIVKIYSV
jgi:uncharacterized membrane protein